MSHTEQLKWGHIFKNTLEFRKLAVSPFKIHIRY